MGIVYQVVDLKQVPRNSMPAPISWVYRKLQKLVRYFVREKERYVALKLIFCNQITDEEAVLRFKREVKRLAEAHHPYIVRFYDAHLESVPYYYTMEYLEGKTLDEITRTVRKNSLWVAHTFEKEASLFVVSLTA
ncbi:MAG: protein kinase [Candidatus Brocadiae bacterium]|nr:protein kinase [Candidatus Brocadiia bacterium]